MAANITCDQAAGDLWTSQPHETFEVSACTLYSGTCLSLNFIHLNGTGDRCSTGVTLPSRHAEVRPFQEAHGGRRLMTQGWFK